MSPKKEPASVKTIGSHRVGDVVELTAVRMNDQGVFLDAGTGNTSDDILLHKHQMTSPVSVGDKVKVQLYLDAKNRITASMKLPKMREGQLGYVNVISVNRMGGFVDIGAERGVFLPYSEMRGHVSPNQHIWVKLYRDKSGRQAVTMRVEEDMERASRPAEGVKVGDALTGTVYNILKDGFFLFTKERYIAFIHRSEVPGGRLDFGQRVTGRVTYVRADGHIDMSLRLVKEEAMLDDADKILFFLEKRNGTMPYSDDTPPAIIKSVGRKQARRDRILTVTTDVGKNIRDANDAALERHGTQMLNCAIARGNAILNRLVKLVKGAHVRELKHTLLVLAVMA